MSGLNFAIIGCGKIALRHASEAVRFGQLLAVCDSIPGKADQLAGSTGARAFHSLPELLAAKLPIDVLAVCTPNGLHAEHTIRALEAGFHVLCEKPLCIHSEEGRKMMETAEKCDRKLFVVKSTRYNPAIRALKKALDTGLLGQLFSFQLNCFWNRPASYYKDSWKGTALDGGTLYTQFSHYIDALLWMLGEIRDIKGFRKNLAHANIILSEDSGVVALEMESGITGGINWSVNAYRENMEVSFTLMAEKATIQLGGPYMNELKYFRADGFTIDNFEMGMANDYGDYRGSMSNHNRIYENLVRALQDKDHPYISASDGLKTVEAIEKIYKSVSLS